MTELEAGARCGVDERNLERYYCTEGSRLQKTSFPRKPSVETDEYLLILLDRSVVASSSARYRILMVLM
jgi:hypothetical protein